MDDAPLILTALLPPELQREFTALRTAHFPPERNFLSAHVTLFHALPPQCESELQALCKRLAAEFAPVDGEVAGLMSLGRGVAVQLASPAMLRLRSEIADHFHGMLTRQDQHAPRLHVTIQNKVSPQEAKALLERLQGSIAPGAFRFRGLGLFRYRGGPWEPLREFVLRGKQKA